jgi:hypothetical protein
MDRGQQLIQQKRWWEALDSLNRIDHPWWKTHSQGLRQQVQKGIAQPAPAKEEREHEGHRRTPTPRMCRSPSLMP